MTAATLDVVRAAVVHDARERASADVAAARADADAVLGSAGRKAEAILAQARADGEAAALRTSAAVVAAARREGRERVLAARRRVYDELRRAARATVAGTGDSAVEALFARLEELARRRLGPNAAVFRSPAGVRATAGARTIEVTVDDAIDRELEQLGERVAELWQ